MQKSNQMISLSTNCNNCANFDGKYCIRYFEDSLHPEDGGEVITKVINIEHSECEDFVEIEDDR